MMYTDDSKGVRVAKDPAVVRFRDIYYMYYSVCERLDDGTMKWGIGIARSSDMESWEKIGEIEGAGELESTGICAPAAFLHEGRIHLFYQTYGRFEKDAICHAWSDDGIRFTRNQTNPILRARGNWNNGRAIDADVCVFRGELYLYFATRDPEGKIQMQGVSKCPLDGRFERGSWKQCCEDAVLKPELEWEQECIEAAATIVKDGRVYLFYAGAYNNSPQQIGVAVSDDGVHFTRLSEEPFVKNGEEGSWNSSESGHPYVFEDEDGRIYLFYQGNNDNGKSWYLSKLEIDFQNGVPYIVSK
ncbi:MAG: family 43 glycosylhydrolase [Lachnospiraceae bacterium]|nr:family 43 glycosylhydrolase [uncultured Acetatifactor sp.]MCI8543062.1 family 43 glycosylhydrolase [Lachnospiraceae bacterium]